jgi:YidC/Oxa1 family membrane protein insertase
VLDFIYIPVSAILWFWHKVFGAIPFLGPNHGLTWALAVVFLVFTLRALLFKPFVSQVRSMRKMQEFAPQIRKLQEKYKGDRQRVTQEMQKLQAEHGVNPLGGCLPILIQIPVFIGLFHVLREFKPGKTSNYVFGADEVNSFLQADLFGTKLSAYMTLAQDQLALLDTTRVATALVAIPLMIIASIATHITARHSVERQSAAAAANPQAAIMNKLTLYIFPIGVLVGGPFFPIAILIYWLSNNLWTLGQQWVVYRKIDQEESEKKEQAAVQRQALGPRPGQKPASPKKRPSASGSDSTPNTAAGNGKSDSAAAGEAAERPVDAVPDGKADGSTDGKPAGASAESDAGKSSGNGAAPAGKSGKSSSKGGSAGDGSGNVPGMIQKRPPRSKKGNRKRR